jgi:hypothetical protein
MWLYHRRFEYPFVTLLVREWMHCSPWYTLRYHCSYCIREWTSHTKKGFPTFSPTIHGDESIFSSPKTFFRPWWTLSLSIRFIQFGVTCFNNNNTCNNSYPSRQGMIVPRANAKRWFYSFSHQNLRLFPSSFWFLFYFLCACQYNLPSIDLFGTFNVYILL